MDIDRIMVEGIGVFRPTNIDLTTVIAAYIADHNPTYGIRWGWKRNGDGETVGQIAGNPELMD